MVNGKGLDNDESRENENQRQTMRSLENDLTKSHIHMRRFLAFSTKALPTDGPPHLKTVFIGLICEYSFSTKAR